MDEGFKQASVPFPVDKMKGFLDSSIEIKTQTSEKRYPVIQLDEVDELELDKPTSELIRVNSDILEDIKDIDLTFTNIDTSFAKKDRKQRSPKRSLDLAGDVYGPVRS